MQMKDIESQIPKKVKQANELLCLDRDDDVISILRHFDWNQQKLEDVWFGVD